VARRRRPGAGGRRPVRGYDPDVVDDIATADVADLVLVKADGARTREFKAPNEREPQLPRHVDTVVPIASVQAVGKPLSADHVHRPERVAAITGLDRGDAIRPKDVARVLASDRGGHKGVPDGATVVPLLNKVDDAEMRDVAADIGRELLERAPAVRQVVLARMVAEEPVIDVLGTWSSRLVSQSEAQDGTGSFPRVDSSLSRIPRDCTRVLCSKTGYDGISHEEWTRRSFDRSDSSTN